MNLMEKRTFEIPDNCDETDVDDVPSYFQPGKIIKSIDCDAVKDCQSSQVKSMDIDLNSDNGQPNSASITIEEPPATATASSSSTFENAFSELKTSKYFENEMATGLSEGGSKPSGSYQSHNSLLVNPRQRGNPLLKSIRNVPWEFAEIEPDYVMGKTMCALFLSMRYHNLYPNYIHERLKALGRSFQLRVLLVQVDVVEPSEALKNLSVIALLADCTLMVAWSPEEAGNYLETYKMSENKSADSIKEKSVDDHYAQIINSLTKVRSINKNDAAVLLHTFGTLAKVMQASYEDLAACSGIGPLKAKRLYAVFNNPVINEERNEEEVLN